MEQETSFGSWLRQRRKVLDLTQWDLAELVGCSGSTVQKIEDGVRRPSRQVAELLADVLRVEPQQRDTFVHWARLGYEDDPTARPNVPDQTRTPAAASPTAAATLTPPAGQPTSPPVSLPAPLTQLIGREHEVQKLLECLSRPEVRLLTLIGPPGIGKTRLGIRLAAESTRDFEHGVYFVGLAGIIDPDLVLPAIAQTLGVQCSETQVESAVACWVGDKRILLVLDNFEQVLDATPQVLDLLSACPCLRLVVTSREALRAPGEWRFPVPPLQLLLPRKEASTELSSLARVASVALFVERAEAVRPDFTLTEHNVGSIAAICMRLDGLPLAIELAAARTGLLTPAEIESRLDSCLNLLKGGSVRLPARQRTLRGTLDWSYNLLNTAEKRLFSRMAVFSGGCSLEDVDRVCGGDDGASGEAEVDILDRVMSLVNKSLLTRTEMGNGGFWLGMLETIREYALERFEESGEAENIQRLYALYYRDLAMQAETGLLTAQQDAWVRRLSNEHDNLRAALEWCLGRDDDELSIVALSIAGSLWRFWWMRGHLSEGRRWLERALEAANRTSGGEAGECRIRALKAKALKGLGNLALSQTDYVAAHSLYEAALEINREVGDDREVGALLNNLGNVNAEMGRSDESRRALEEGLAIARRTGYDTLIAAVLSNLGGVAVDQGDYQHARAYAAEALALAREAGDKAGMANSLTKLGIASMQLGEFSRAHDELAEALQLCNELGDYLTGGSALETLGVLACDEENYEEARSLHLQALAIRLELGHKSGVVECLRSLAEVAVETGNVECAARLYGAAEALREEVGASFFHPSRKRYERFTAVGRERMGEAAWDEATREGRCLRPEQAAALARGELELEASYAGAAYGGLP